MAYMKKKTRMRSKKNARKTKRIRGGAASNLSPSPYQSFLKKRAEETKNSDRLASRKLNADYITVVEKAIVKLEKDISNLEKKSELDEKEKKDLSYFRRDLERRNEQLPKLKEMAESRLMLNENQRR